MANFSTSWASCLQGIVMPDTFLNLIQNVLKENQVQIFDKKIIKRTLPNEDFNLITGSGLFKKITGKELHKKTVFIDSEAGTYEYNSYYENGVYTLEPEEPELPIIKSRNIDYELGELSRKNIIEKITLKNNYSYLSVSSYPVNAKLLLIGEGLVQEKRIVWFHCLDSIDFKDLVEQYVEMQKHGIDFLICSQFDDLVSGVDPNESNVGIVKLGNTFLIDPSVYCKFFAPSLLENLIDIQKYPVLIDLVGKYVYFCGQKVNRTSETNVYKFLVALFSIPSGVAFKNEGFCQKYYGTKPQSEESYRSLADRSKELRRQLKRIFSKDSAKHDYFNNALLSPRLGYIKCEIPSSDVFWWPTKPSS